MPTVSSIDLYLAIGCTARYVMMCLINQALVNFTGCTAKMQIRDSASTNVVTLSTANGGLVLGGAAGTISVWLQPSQTATLAPVIPAVTPVGFVGTPAQTTLSYDILVTLASGDVEQFVAGKVWASPTVTTLP